MQKVITDKPVVLLVLAGILFLSLFLQHEFDLKQALLFLTGVGLGLTLMYALFGFSGAWRQFIRDRKSIGVRAHILLIALSSVLFFPVIGGVFESLHASSAMGQVGVSVLVGAFLFGIGMQLGGGCGSGTLFTVGQGQVDMLITLAFFIVGATLGSVHLGWWLSQPNIGKISLINELGWLPALLLQLGVLFVMYQLVRFVDIKRRSHLGQFKEIERDDLFGGLVYRLFEYFELFRHVKLKPVFSAKIQRDNLTDQLIYGPWPVLWGVIGLSLFGLLTLLQAGYPWSITYAFGLWGAKIWSALGGDVSNWTYWSGGYPAKSLNSSVLADITTIMDFGIIAGAMLAAAMAGKFAPKDKVTLKRAITAMIGGLLLGYGARLAFGCNIGGMLGGMASGSLHGWLWLVAGFSGGIVGVKMRVWLKIDKPYGAKQ